MYHNSYLKMGIVMVLFFALAACQESSVNDRVDFVPKNDFERHLVDKVGIEEAQQMSEKQRVNLRVPVTYSGELCPGELQIGAAPATGGCCGDLGFSENWYFSGSAGDNVTIVVTRIDCNMDPVAWLYEGSGDTDVLTLLNGQDDNVADPCNSCFADPTINHTLPSTGTYTVAVWDLFSCGATALDYTIVLTGVSACTVVIDGCDTGVSNDDLPGGGTIADAIADCAANAKNHGQFVSCVAHLTNAWKAAGLIDDAGKEAIMECAAESSLP